MNTDVLTIAMFREIIKEYPNYENVVKKMKELKDV